MDVRRDDFDMRFKFFNIEFFISVFFPIILCLMLLIDSTGMMSASFFAVIVHEIGHLFVMKIFKCTPRKIELTFAGILISGTDNLNRKENFFILFGGPFFNIIFGFFLYFLYNYLKLNLFIVNSAVQLSFAALNLIPINGLDGGSLLTILLSVFFGNEKSEFVSTVVSLLFTVVIIFVGITVVFIGKGNISLLLLGIYMGILNFVKVV